MFDEAGLESQPVSSKEKLKEEFNGPYGTEKADTEFVMSFRDDM
jgi:hypothetical protein